MYRCGCDLISIFDKIAMTARRLKARKLSKMSEIAE